LTNLKLYSNKFTDFPKAILDLKNLTKLDLESNQLTNLPKEIGDLKNLTELDLSSNQLTSLPKEFNKLNNLTNLKLYSNKFTDFPKAILDLKNLTELSLSKNQLTNLPKEIGDLKNLIELDLSKNQLENLPYEIGNLKKLNQLNLDSNHLRFLPIDIVKLENLRKFSLARNPIKLPPPEIITQGIMPIFEYISKLPKDYAKNEVNEAKLILVGQGSMGKTCLAKRLITGKFQEDATTEGIDVLNWKVNSPDQTKLIKINVWDFGGQEIYHATHQFFLTTRSVYLLVWNARMSKHDFDLIYYWLHTIEAFGVNSPTILVMTKCNERDDDLNMKDLRTKFPQIIKHCKVDCLDGKGITELIETISESMWSLPQMGTIWIPEWMAVRKDLENDDRNQIRCEEYYSICSKRGVNKKLADILSEYLHNLGIIIHFKDDLILQNTVILKPDWATRAVYKVLDTQSVLKQQGILYHNQLPEIWDDPTYPTSIYPMLLKLMERFELAYELPDKQSHLVAELLPSTELEFDWDNDDNLRFFYRYDFLPAGIITRFVVRMHKDLHKRKDGKYLCWREGLVLYREKTYAYIRVKIFEKIIEINISGINKRELLTIIRHEFDTINKSIRKVKITKEIPCNCNRDCTYVFNYDRLIDAEKKGKKEVECQDSWDRVPLLKLIDGYEIRERKMEDGDKILKAQGDIHLHVTQDQIVHQQVSQVQESKQEVNVDIDIKIDLPEIQSDIQKLKELMLKADPQLKKEMKTIGEQFDNISSDSSKDKLKAPFNKLFGFLKKLDDENSDINKIMRGSKKGIQTTQKIGKTYNKFAQWLALPQVPDLFLGG